MRPWRDLGRILKIAGKNDRAHLRPRAGNRLVDSCGKVFTETPAIGCILLFIFGWLTPNGSSISILVAAASWILCVPWLLWTIFLMQDKVTEDRLWVAKSQITCLAITGSWALPSHLRAIFRLGFDGWRVAECVVAVFILGFFIAISD